MQKRNELLLIIIAIACVFIVAFGLRYFFIQIFYAEPTVIQSYPSPDGKYTAYVFESNGGATTGFIYHVSVLPSKKTLGKGNGNIYIGTVPPNKIEWIDNDTLYVDDYRSINTTKRKQKIYDITVKFNSIEIENKANAPLDSRLDELKNKIDPEKVILNYSPLENMGFEFSQNEHSYFAYTSFELEGKYSYTASVSIYKNPNKKDTGISYRFDEDVLEYGKNKRYCKTLDIGNSQINILLIFMLTEDDVTPVCELFGEILDTVNAG